MRQHSRYDAPDRGKRKSDGSLITSQDSLSKQSKTITSIYNKIRTNPNRTTNLALGHTVISIIFIYLFILIIEPSHQQHNTQLCPKVCSCDNQNLEVICKGPFDASGLPHTLNPSTRRITVNHAQTTQFTSSDLEYFRSLELLDMAFNRLSVIDFDHIRFNVNLNYLNASHNNIVELKDSAVSMIAGKLPNSVDNAGITDSDEYKKLKKSKIHVIEFNVSNNHLTVLKDFTFLRWYRLQKLDLSYNSIETLESDSLSGLSKLEHLILRGNRITQIPARAFLSTVRSLSHVGTNEETISALKALELSENPLLSIEADSFNSLRHVKEIYLDSCLINSIDSQAFNGLPSITTLSIANNNLVEVPTASLNTITTLKTLRMSSNDIRFLRPYAFRHLKNLEELYLNNGSLQEVRPQAFEGLAELNYLDLNNNSNLTKVDSSIFDLPKLSHLGVQMGSLKTLIARDNIDKDRLIVVDLRGNSLICDCDLKWLTNSLKKLNETVNLVHASETTDGNMLNFLKTFNSEKAIDSILSLTCAGPAALTGKQIINLPDNKLECIRPNSRLNVHIGFASLFFLILVLITVCLINFCRNEKHLMGILKENLVQNRLSMMMPYSQDEHKNIDNFTKETQIECADYEPIDYGQNYGPIYTLPEDRFMNVQQFTHNM